jgi:hypothetical protein
LEKIELSGTKTLGRAFDWQFAKDCTDKGIPMMVDTSIRMLHVAGRSPRPENWGIGFKEPCIRFETTRGPDARSYNDPEKYHRMVESFSKVISNP